MVSINTMFNKRTSYSLNNIDTRDEKQNIETNDEKFTRFARFYAISNIIVQTLSKNNHHRNHSSFGLITKEELRVKKNQVIISYVVKSATALTQSDRKKLYYPVHLFGQ